MAAGINKSSFPLWPNMRTAIITNTITTTIACELTFPESTKMVNASFRVCSIAAALYERKYYKIAWDMSAFAALFLPRGEFVSVVIDLTSIWVYWHKQKSALSASAMTQKCEVPAWRVQLHPFLLSKQGLDPTNPADAYKILNIPHESANDLSLIEESYNKLNNSLQKKLTKIAPGLSAQLQQLITDASVAYNTLKTHLE